MIHYGIEEEFDEDSGEEEEILSGDYGLYLTGPAIALLISIYAGRPPLRVVKRRIKRIQRRLKRKGVSAKRKQKLRIRLKLLRSAVPLIRKHGRAKGWKKWRKKHGSRREYREDMSGESVMGYLPVNPVLDQIGDQLLFGALAHKEMY